MDDHLQNPFKHTYLLTFAGIFTFFMANNSISIGVPWLSYGFLICSALLFIGSIVGMIMYVICWIDIKKLQK